MRPRVRLIELLSHSLSSYDNTLEMRTPMCFLYVPSPYPAAGSGPFDSKLTKEKRIFLRITGSFVSDTSPTISFRHFVSIGKSFIH